MPVDDDDLRAQFERELGRVGDRLRSLGLARLGRPGTGGRTPADQGHAVAQELADLAADCAGRGRRLVPVLPVHVVADQLLVTGHDLLTEGDAAAVRAGLEALVALRRTL